MPLCIAVLFIALTGILLVSITWTHRPNLSVFDILREVIREIGKHRKSTENQQKIKDS